MKKHQEVVAEVMAQQRRAYMARVLADLTPGHPKNATAEARLWAQCKLRGAK